VALSVLVFAVSWVSYDFARTHRIQLLSIAFAVLGLAQLFLLYRVTARGKKVEETALAAA
jgi:hypothetical protein